MAPYCETNPTLKRKKSYCCFIFPVVLSLHSRPSLPPHPTTPRRRSLSTSERIPYFFSAATVLFLSLSHFPCSHSPSSDRAKASRRRSSSSSVSSSSPPFLDDLFPAFFASSKDSTPSHMSASRSWPPSHDSREGAETAGSKEEEEEAAAAAAFASAAGDGRHARPARRETHLAAASPPANLRVATPRCGCEGTARTETSLP